MSIKVGWTPEAAKKREELIKGEPKLQSYFSATYQSLVNGEIAIKKEGSMEIFVEFTRYKLVLDIETDRIARIKFVDIVNVK
jgi:hypothetical protein